MTFLFKPDEAPKQIQIEQRFYEMKFRITPGAWSDLQGNSDFMNIIQANDLIPPPFTPNLIIPFLQAVDFTVINKEEGVKDVTSLFLFICTKLVSLQFQSNNNNNHQLYQWLVVEALGCISKGFRGWMDTLGIKLNVGMVQK